MGPIRYVHHDLLCSAEEISPKTRCVEPTAQDHSTLRSWSRQCSTRNESRALWGAKQRRGEGSLALLAFGSWRSQQLFDRRTDAVCLTNHHSNRSRDPLKNSRFVVHRVRMQGLMGRYSLNHLPRPRSLVIPTKMLLVADKVLQIQQKRIPCVFSGDGRIRHDSQLPIMHSKSAMYLNLQSR